ncbi:hypothetical protein NDU88_001307 [Pleurodeles waltl]|uniref:Uncharacterized protein n=1 Tax=Pleurodeles waltl TaxID=8319 RepID=A0AAV7VBF8_PLEWA|nr:hypothetical protein NDU88_001307 [Pleurodeles waltl]
MAVPPPPPTVNRQSTRMQNTHIKGLLWLALCERPHVQLTLRMSRTQPALRSPEQKEVPSQHEPGQA